MQTLSIIALAFHLSSLEPLLREFSRNGQASGRVTSYMDTRLSHAQVGLGSPLSDASLLH